MEYQFLGKQISGPFTIPSGIITTTPEVIQRVAHDIPEIGVITTKSINESGKEGNREPIVTSYAPGCFMNAVGLTNPGAERFAEQLSQVEIPEDRFLLISIFGDSAESFVRTAQKLEGHADGFELNLSCPHVSGCGAAMGSDPEKVQEIVSAVKEAVSVPVVAKLTPNVADIASIARAARDGGADGICAINTAGPGYYAVDGQPVLSNAVGGMSGKGVLPIGLKCIKEIRQAVDLPIIGCGGASTGADVRSYVQAGADVIGVGSALAGIDTPGLARYFSALHHDLLHGTDTAETGSLPGMDFTRYRLSAKETLTDDLALLRLDGALDAKPGQFVFVWLPGTGEKPFSVLDTGPLTLAVQERGCFSRELIHLPEDTPVYVRGPYGVSPTIPDGTKVILVSGGCGLAATYRFAKDHDDAHLFVGARSSSYLFYIEEARQQGHVHLATDDGSTGYHGTVTELLAEHLQGIDCSNAMFLNCGPQVMVDAAVKIEEQYVSRSRIYNAIDYVTSCGVGICGSCSTPEGKRLCVDGPFINEEG